MLAELARRGYATVDEPGRRVVREQIASGGSALPWRDLHAFLQRTFALAVADCAASAAVLTFFDRGMIDAAIGLEHLTHRPAASVLVGQARYERLVFLTPPWPEIYITDTERRHGFDEAVAEYERLLCGFDRLGYDVRILPKVGVSARADAVLAQLARPSRE